MFLTEETPLDFVKQRFPNSDVVSNKSLSISGRQMRPDILVKDRNLVVEFDGYRHYQNTSVILADMAKDTVLRKAGYNPPHYLMTAIPQGTTKLRPDIEEWCRDSLTEGFEYRI